MIKLSSVNKIFFLLFICLFAVLLIAKPEICKDGVTRSVLLCGKVLIPSLFPFGVCMLYIMKSGITEKLSFLSPFTTKIFKLSPVCFVIMVLSMLGGYPIGAKLISERVSQGELSKEEGRKMLNFCVNAGPGFIVSAVGNGLLRNNTLGYILLITHILASLLICLFSGGVQTKVKTKTEKISPTDNFVLSAGESASAVICICGFVILFGVITAYIEFFSMKLSLLKPLVYISEVTTAISKTNNIYLISFLLGFSGISIWCQVLAVGKAIEINIFSFAFHRLLHGAVSTTLTFLILRIFPVELTTFSNTDFVKPVTFVSGEALGISILILGAVFIISLTNLQKNTKILEELI